MQSPSFLQIIGVGSSAGGHGEDRPFCGQDLYGQYDDHDDKADEKTGFDIAEHGADPPGGGDDQGCDQGDQNETFEKVLPHLFGSDKWGGGKIIHRYIGF